MQKRPLKNTIALILSVIGGVFLFRSQAQAAITVAETSPSHFDISGFTGSEGCVDSLSITGSSAFSSGTSRCFNPTSTSVVFSASGTVHLVLGGPDSYAIWFSNSSSGSNYLNPPPSDSVQFSVDSNGHYVPIVADQSSHFIDPYIPANGTFSTTSPTVFQATYNFSCSDFGSYDLVSFDIKDVSDPNFVPETFPQSINICGQGTFQNSVVLHLSDQYLWRPVMYSSAGSSTPIYGNYYSFLATSTPNYTPFSPFIGSTFGSSSLPDTTNLLTFLNVPQLLQTKVPFAYFFQVAAGLTIGLQSSSTNPIPPGTFTWHNIQGGTTTIDMFSPTSIEYYLSPTLISMWRALLTIVLYTEFGYALYIRGKALHII